MEDPKVKPCHWVIDWETLSNCSILCAEHYKTEEKKAFVIHDLQNDIAELIGFFEECRNNKSWHVGFNTLAFDAQITEFVLRNKLTLLKLPGHRVADLIYQKAQDVINRSRTKQWQEYPEWELSINQVDVFSLAHWSNPAKMSSLKWIQCNMDWHNVQDMPIDHTAVIMNMTEINMIKSYCYNDVSSTKKVMNLAKEQINLRAKLTHEYGINLYSASEPRMSKELFLHFLSEKMGIKKQDLKKINTVRDKIEVNKIILPYVHFEKHEFKMLLNNFNALVINGNQLRGAFKYSIAYKEMKIDFGMGGVHGMSKSQIYEAKDGMIIMSSDVKSYYPNLIIKNKWSPAHIPKKIFCDQYEWFYEERKKYPKKDPKNYVLKILLNSTFGLSIEPNSFLADSQLGCQTTINGQLLLCMLLEMLCEGIPDSKPLMMNTDGFELMIPEQHKQLYLDICKKWETITQLELEHDQYSKLFAFDCNNYYGLFTNGSTKAKGRFEFEPHDKYELASLHKNKSFLIVPKAIYHYLINGIDPKQYLQDNRNVFDYCGYVRAKGQWQLTEYSTGTEGITTKKIQKTLRYYISKNGKKIVKINKADGREIQIEAGKTKCTEFNMYEKKVWEDYDIDDKYYLDQIYKEIETLMPKEKAQLQLF